MGRSEGHLFQHSAEAASAWVNELEHGLGVKDQRYALRVMRAVLHAVRDRLTVPAAAGLAAQFPEVIRGLYYEGWRPATTPRTDDDLDDFLDEITSAAGLAGHSEASLCAAAVFTLITEHVTPGETDAVLAALPGSIATAVRTAPSPA